MSTDLTSITLKDTCITEEMASKISKEDYKYYYVDPSLARPAQIDHYTPPKSLMMTTFGKKKSERLIYPEEGPFTDQEEDAYFDLLEYFEQMDETIPDSMTKRRALRFLNGNGFNIKKTYDNIIKHIQWRQDMKPFVLEQGDIDLLKKGCMYVHGRDRNFRPFLVINAKVIADKGVSPDNVFQTAWFVCHYMIENLLYRGKAENWVDIMDLGGLPISKIPVKALKKFVVESQTHMKSRVVKFFLLHVTWGIRTIYSVISPFLEKRTKEKLTMKKGGYNDEMFDYADPSQIEEKYGGDAEDLTEFWPPREISDEYGVDPDCIKMPAKTSKKNSRKSEHKKKVKQEEVLVGAGPTPVGMTDQDLEFVAEAREDRRRKVEKAGKGKNCTCTIF